MSLHGEVVQPPTGEETTEPAVEVGSVAIISPGDRVDKLTGPLSTTAIETVVNPPRPADADVIVCDTPDREMFKAVASKPVHGTPVVYRMRGDPFWGLKEWIDSRAKRWLALNVMLRRVSGCIAIAPHQANKFRRKTGVRTLEVGLPIVADEWPTVVHTERELRIVTLTNAMYWPKVEPLIDAAPIVESMLERVGGYWRIGSWSERYADELAAALDEYEHVTFDGRLDAHAELSLANLMIHYSNFDVLPNATLEGMASGVPVVTNDHVAFTQSDAPLTTCRRPNDLRVALETFVEPEPREWQGQDGIEYVRRNHAPDMVGEWLQAALEFFATGGDHPWV